MKEKKARRAYEPPRARDLSAFSVSGQWPMGICEHGQSPITFTCQDGPNPTQPTACSPTGTLPTRGRCTQGGNAVEGCFNGSGVNDCVSGGSFV